MHKVHLQFTRGSGDPPPLCWHPQMCWSGRHWSHAVNLTHLKIWKNDFVWVFQFQPVIPLVFPTLTAFPLICLNLMRRPWFIALDTVEMQQLRLGSQWRYFGHTKRSAVHSVSQRLGRFPWMRNENMKKKHLDDLFEIGDSPQVKETTENHPSLASDFHKKRRNEETANCWGPALVTAHGASLPLRCWPSPRLVNVQWQVEDSSIQEEFNHFILVLIAGI